MIYTYQTLQSPSEGNYQESGSKFIAFAFPVKDRVSLQDRLAELKTLHPTARHQCYGYRLLERNEITEYASDAGEPSGSAGAPILGEIRRNAMINVLVIVVRYFGGTKLGIPGLIHAYRQSTAHAIAAGNILVMHQMVKYRISLPLGLQPKFFHACKHYGIEIEEPEYASLFSAKVNLPLIDHEEQMHLLLMMMAGRQGTNEQLLDLLGAKIMSDE